MKIFEGKRFLMLGSNVGSDDMVTYARENGAYTIVADFLPEEKSFAKPLADESVLISTGDLEALKVLVTEKHVDGIFAGVSEFNLLQAMYLSSFFNLPFYCNRAQWDMIENKEYFRKLCSVHQVPSPKTFFSGTSVPDDIYSIVKYPLVVKPVDSSASIGITICYDEQTFRKAIPEAFDHSEAGAVIIEEYFVGEEFSAHYTIADGIVSLSCVDNRFPVAVNEGVVTTIPVARIYPSTFIDEYIRQVDQSVISLCKSLNLNTGVLFVQGLYNAETNKFCIFEGGLRCAGEGPYRFLQKVNGVNFMNNFVDYSLLGHVVGFDSNKEDPYLHGKACCTLSFVSKGGKVGSIEGYDEVVNTNSHIVSSECRYHVGDITPVGNTLRQIMLRFVLICDSPAQLADNIEFINRHVIVRDDKGDNLCLTFDVDLYRERIAK